MNGSTNGRSILSTGVIPCFPRVSAASLPSSGTTGNRAEGRVPDPADPDLVAVDRDAADDLAEGERDDRDVVAAQAQRRQPDRDPGDRREDDRDDDDQEEVHVDAGQLASRASRRSMWKPAPPSAPEKKFEPSQPIV